MSVPVMIGPPPVPVPMRPASGAGGTPSGSDAFSGVLDEAHESQRSDRAVARSRSADHSQAPEHAHGAEAAKHHSDGDDAPAPATGGADPSAVAGGLLVSGGLTPPPPAPDTPVASTAPTATADDATPPAPAATLLSAAVPLERADAAVVAAGAIDPHDPAVPATPAVPAPGSAAGSLAADPITDDPITDGPITDGPAVHPADPMHRATRATPAVPATPASHPEPGEAVAPARPDAAVVAPTTPGGVTPAVPAVAATPATPAHRADTGPATADPTAASAVVSTGFAASLRDVADPAAPRAGKRITVDESPTVTGPSAPTALRVDTVAPVADVGSIRPAQAPLPEQPLLLGALSRLRDHGNGVHELTVSLHPAELGAVNVTAVVRDGSITVSLAVVDPAARAAVTSALHGLRHDLAQSGFSGVDVSVSDHGRQGQPGESRSHGRGDLGPASRDDRADERPTPRRHIPTDRSLDRLL